MDADSFSSGQDALSKSPASAHGLVGRSPASAKWGGLLFGYFLLAAQEKVARPPQEGESSASKNINSESHSDPSPQPYRSIPLNRYQSKVETSATAVVV